MLRLKVFDESYIKYCDETMVISNGIYRFSRRDGQRQDRKPPEKYRMSDLLPNGYIYLPHRKDPIGGVQRNPLF